MSDNLFPLLKNYMYIIIRMISLPSQTQKKKVHELYDQFTPN